MSVTDMSGSLGRRAPKDFEHFQKFSLTAATVPDKPTPVVLGCNWYASFDAPVRDSTGRYWIGRGSLGKLRGGHAICVKPEPLSDPNSWWDFYNQGEEGACVGFSSSRMMSLLNRKRYAATWLYQQAQLIDGFDDTPPAEGTTVRAAFETLRKQGHCAWVAGKARPVALQEGIAAYRWATSVEEVHAVLKSPIADKLGAVPLVNSWGRSYPHVVYLPDAVLDRLRREDGEVGLVTDR
jgi:hypothetical protein